MSKTTKTDIIVIALLLLLTFILPFNELIHRSHVVAPGGTAASYIAADKQAGGASTAVYRSDETAFVMDYDLRDATVNPYVTLGIPLKEISFDWFERITIRARVTGGGSGRYRIYLRNNEQFTDPADWSSRRQNESLFLASGEFGDIEIPRESFKVPTWWLDVYGLGPEESVPGFDRIVEIAVSTGALARSESAVLEIESITMQGHWIPPLRLYRIMLAFWVSTILFLALRRSILAAKRIRLSRNKMERIRDINRELGEERSRMARIAFTDELTGALNRAGLHERIAVIREDRDVGGVPFCLILFDIDDFKRINDTRGHSAGDKALVELVAVIRDSIRDTDLLCRWGGEEFIVIGANTSLDKGALLAEKLRRRVEESDLGFTCSFGVSEKPGHSLEEMLQAADEALYDAKLSGKNTVVPAD